jgi:hypothetical protein
MVVYQYLSSLVQHMLSISGMKHTARRVGICVMELEGDSFYEM